LPITKIRLIGAFTVYRQSVRLFDSKTLQMASMFAATKASSSPRMRNGSVARNGE
jgi:hypothetical protein